MNCYYNLKGLRNNLHKISFELHQNIKYDQMKQDTTIFISTSISTPNSFEYSIKTKKCLSPPQQPASATSYITSAMCHVHSLKLPARHSWRSCLFSLFLPLALLLLLISLLSLLFLASFTSWSLLSSPFIFFFSLASHLPLCLSLSSPYSHKAYHSFFSPLPLISLLH